MTELAQALCPLIRNGPLLAWAAGKHLIVYSTEEKKFELNVTNEGHTDAIRSIAFSKNGSRIATAGEDKSVIIWSKNENEEWKISSRFLHIKKLMTVHFDQNDCVVFSDKFGEFFRVKKEESNSFEMLFGHLAAVTASLFSPHRGILISADRDEKIRITDYPNTSNIQSFLLGHRKYVSCLSWFDELDHTRIVSAGADGLVILWDISDLSDPVMVWKISVGDGPINSICIDHQNHRVLVLRTEEPSVIITIENGVVLDRIALQIAAQAILVNNDCEVFAIDSMSHLMIGLNRVEISENVTGIPISLMKMIHHENFQDEEISHTRKKQK